MHGNLPTPLPFSAAHSPESDFLGCSPFPNYVEADMMRLEKNLNLIGFNSQ